MKIDLAWHVSDRITQLAYAAGCLGAALVAFGKHYPI